MKQDTIVRSSRWFRGTVFTLLVCLAAPMMILGADNPDSTAVGTRTVEGLVRDIACRTYVELRGRSRLWEATRKGRGRLHGCRSSRPR